MRLSPIRTYSSLVNQISCGHKHIVFNLKLSKVCWYPLFRGTRVWSEDLYNTNVPFPQGDLFYFLQLGFSQ
ncbi:MAG: hypothetical protein ACFFAE_22060 [Candidatus Hodarchaeota archaeon]